MGAVELRGHWFVVAFVGGCSFTTTIPTVTDGPVDGKDAPTEGLPSTPTTCKTIKAAMPSAPTGPYLLDPDGPEGFEAPITAVCDMTTDNGGWTIIFLPASSNLASSNVGYTASTEGLLNAANQVLLAFRDSAHAVVGQRATFPMIQEWRVSSPFMYPNLDVSVIASIDGASAMNATLKFGYNSFSGDLCTDGWDTSVRWGRLCIGGTNAPFYTGFATTISDTCPASQQLWNARNCGAELKLTIAVR